MDIYEEYLKNAKYIEDYSDNERYKFKDTIEKKIFKSEENCKHSEITQISEKNVCIECGFVMKEDLSYDKDWKYSSKDASQYHKRKPEQRSLFKDVEGMDFPESIVQNANKKYQNIIKNNIYRGSKRKAIIVACIYYAYIEQGEHRTSEEISKKFNIKKKSIKEGFTRYCDCFPDASIFYINAKNLIRQIMVRTDINFIHLRKINKLCDFLENKSALLNRSNPQSVAAAIVYLYLCLEPEYKNKLGMTKIKFAKIVDLSDITITKLGKESQRIIQNEELKI